MYYTSTSWRYTNDLFKYLAFRLPPSKQMTKDERVAWREHVKKRKERGHKEAFIPKSNEPLSHLGFPGGQATERYSGVLIFTHQE